MHSHSMHTYIISKSKMFKKRCLPYFFELDSPKNVLINFKQRDSDSDICKRHPPPPQSKISYSWLLCQNNFVGTNS